MESIMYILLVMLAGLFLLIVLSYVLAKVITRGALRAKDEHQQELVRKYHEGLDKSQPQSQSQTPYRKDE